MKRMLADVRPELINEWSQRNLPLTPDSVTHGSNKIVWWNGKCGHEWRASIKNRVIGGSGCPYCSHNAILEGYNDLASQKPELAAEWSARNAPLLPTQVTVFANRKAWWKYEDCGNEWEALISTRSDGSRCPYCSGLILVLLATEIHLSRNIIENNAKSGILATLRYLRQNLRQTEQCL